MNSKQYIPSVFHGKWRIPERDEFMWPVSEYQECMGTLYYDEGKPLRLKVYHEPKQGVISSMYHHYNVIWGKDANGYEFTLFNASMNNSMEEDPQTIDFSKMEFTIDYVILGRHVKSMDEPVFDICTIKFPFLRNWAFQDNRDPARNGNIISCNLDLNKGNPFLETEIENGIKITLLPIGTETVSCSRGRIRDSMSIIKTDLLPPAIGRFGIKLLLSCLLPNTP